MTPKAGRRIAAWRSYSVDASRSARARAFGAANPAAFCQDAAARTVWRKRRSGSTRPVNCATLRDIACWNAMNWLRARQRICGWVALFSLALQLALSFGHVDAVAAHRPAVMAVADGSGPSQPASNDDPYCAICATLAMLSGAQIANAPAIAPVVVSISVEMAITSEAATAVRRCAAFRSRAPPIS